MKKTYIEAFILWWKSVKTKIQNKVQKRNKIKEISYLYQDFYSVSLNYGDERGNQVLYSLEIRKKIILEACRLHINIRSDAMSNNIPKIETYFQPEDILERSVKITEEGISSDRWAEFDIKASQLLDKNIIPRQERPVLEAILMSYDLINLSNVFDLEGMKKFVDKYFELSDLLRLILRYCIREIQVKTVALPKK